ncbi:uncharacterized protein LOC116296941 [Actinia tenebrosa]|uniref:Uncharacterized protein LOC116296941 n=1 Tax=Actinia tenebrosa TaxID=6105 RepID=A0A6P8I794_ACTTE|nr:uncharacterized protein LOC116296941 [Actinia tenebrosa]
MSFEKKSTFSSPLKHSTRKGGAVEQWETELLKAFHGQIERKLVVEDQAFTNLDPRNMTSELKSTQKMILRTAQQASKDESIILTRFDPNFMSPREIRCRSPGCKQTKKRQPSLTEPSKEDLYLCPRHRKLLEDYVTKICAEKGIDVGTKYLAGDFEGYISMIGMLESAYFLFVKRPRGTENILKGKPEILKEIFINLRNFLMITNALLNPGWENLFTVLPRVMEIFRDILKILSTDGENIVQRLTELVGLLRSVMQDILFTFGIVYSWVYLTVINANPGAKIGAGIGGFIGMAGLFVASPPVALLAMAGGSIFGGLTGSGIYNLQEQRRQEQEAEESHRRYQEFVIMQRNQENQNEVQAGNNPQVMAEPDGGDVLFHITGSERGDSCLIILLAARLYFGI